ncbi:uncharacterized protein KD926_004142 [Aspergillus affinis]|uniref:uncharacterized protein n=1 Tax=Aspergillus affinis TaxID=1070780 RepID=UPI0022FF3C11|nr:uncharacterized protein KD926_004142 [Aspergillus affinis]KAI9046304.1 integral membrane protein [Aspergillus affinis]
MNWFDDTDQARPNYFQLLLFVLFALFYPSLLSKLEGDYEAPEFTQDLLNLAHFTGPMFFPDMDFVELSICSGIVFAVVIMLGFLIGFWNDISPWIMAGVNKLSSMVLGFKWLAKQLSVVRSYQGLRCKMCLTLEKLKQSTNCRLLYRVAFEAIVWLHSTPTPLVMIIRLMALGSSVVVACIGLFLCGGQLLSGFTAGLFSTQWDMGVYCSFSPRNLFYLPSGRGRWLSEFYCFGRDLGVRLDGAIDWSPEQFEGHQDEWPVLPVIVLALVCVIAWMYCALSQTVAAEQTSTPEHVVQAPAANCVDQETQTKEDPAVLERGRQLEAKMQTKLEALIKTHTSECEGYKKTIKAQEERIAADAAKHRVTEQREVYGAFFSTLSAQRVPLEETSYASKVEPRQRDLTRSVLVEQVEKKNAQLKKAEEELVDANTDREFLSRRIRLLEIKEGRMEDELQGYRTAKAELERQKLEVMAHADTKYANAVSEIISLKDRLAEQNRDLIHRMQRFRDLESLYGQRVQVDTQLEQNYNELVSRHNELESRYATLDKERDGLLVEIELLNAFHNESSLAQQLDAANQRCVRQDGEVKCLEAEKRALQSEIAGQEVLYKGVLAWAAGVDENCRAALDTFTADRDRHLADVEAALETAKARVVECEGLTEQSADQVDLLEGQLFNVQHEKSQCLQEIARLETVVGLLRRRLREQEEAARLSETTPQKRRAKGMGSVTTALEQSQVEVAKLRIENETLRDQANRMAVETSDQAKDDLIRRLRAQVDAERNQKTEAQIASDTRVKAMDAEITRLRVTLSNATTPVGASPFSRSNGRRR